MSRITARLARVISQTKAQNAQGRLIRGVLANLYDKSAVMAVQLLSIPVLNANWGANGYGIWLMLMTLPTYIQLSDFGVASAASVEITKLTVNGKFQEARKVLQSAWVIVTSIVAIIGVVGFGYAYFIYTHPDAFPQGPSQGQFSTSEICSAISLIVVYAMINTQMNIVTNVFRAIGKFAFAMIFAGTLILSEGCSLVLIAYSGGSIGEAALGYVLIRSTGYVVFRALLHRHAPWAKFGKGEASLETAKPLLRPSAATFGLLVANAISLQGVILALGHALGPAVVGAFGSSRTLTRAPLQLAGMLNRPLIPELARALAARETKKAKRLFFLNVVITTLIMLPFLVAFSAFGDLLVSILSHGRLHISRIVICLLAATATANAMWTALASTHMASNQQHRFSYLYLIGAIFVLAATISFQSVRASATAGFFVEMAMLTVLSYLSFVKFFRNEPKEL